METTSLTSKAVRSGTWIYGRTLITNVINLGVMAILARQLAPGDFGLVALAQVLLRFLAILGSGGIGDYIIYDNHAEREERVHAAFWMNGAFSLGVLILGLVTLPLLTGFYTTPGLGPVLALLIGKYFLDQLAVVPDALIKKTINFKILVIRDTVLEIATSLGSVAMALAGYGVWSLVVPNLLAAPLRFFMVLRMARWSPELPLRFERWPGIFKFSANVIGTNLATTITAEGDTLLIGKSLGNEQLGLYNLAWQTANLVSRTITGVFSKLAMPTLSSIANDPERLRNSFNLLHRLLGIVCFPLLVGLFVTADLFILVIYGPQWHASVLPLRILLIYAMRHAVSSPSSVIYNVVGRPDIGMKFGLCFFPFYIVSIWVGGHYGIVGVALGVTVARTLGGIVLWGISAALVKQSLSKLLFEILNPLMASILSGLSVWIARMALESFSIPDLWQLIFLVGIGGLSYLVLLLTLYRKLLDDLMKVLFTTYPGISGSLSRVPWFNKTIPDNKVH